MKLNLLSGRISILFAVALGLGTLLLSCGQDARPGEEVSTQMKRSACQAEKSFLGLDFLATDETGAAIPCVEGKLDVSVSVSYNGENGPFMPVSPSMLMLSCASHGNGEVAATVDLSGSESGELGTIKSAVRALIDNVLRVNGKASVVRVSTHAYTVQPLTDSADDLHAAINGFFLHNGWTALYDGIRLANESFTQAGVDDPKPGFFPMTLKSFCGSGKKRAIVVYTDGRENNSAEQHPCQTCKTPPDGIDTTLEDLLKLNVNGVKTPIYVVGVGNNVDKKALQELTRSTGGRYFGIKTYYQLADKLSKIGSYIASTHQICVELPTTMPCQTGMFKVVYTWEHNGKQTKRTKVYEFKTYCPGT